MSSKKNKALEDLDKQLGVLEFIAVDEIALCVLEGDSMFQEPSLLKKVPVAILEDAIKVLKDEITSRKKA